MAKRFESAKELKDELSKCPWEKWFEIERYRNRESNLKTIIHRSVGGSTLKAFPNLPRHPSTVFRDWASNALDESRLKAFWNSTSKTEYRHWLSPLSQNLRASWKKKMKKDLSIGHSLKLLNLLAKGLYSYKDVPKKYLPTLAWYLEVPLDRFTIQAVANCVRDFPGGSTIGYVRRNASMGFIENLEMYQAFQTGIRSLTSEAKVPPIALDIAVWGVQETTD
ncbi:MAG: hypothetical protein WA634_03550 [Silvibacterium sp.]